MQALSRRSFARLALGATAAAALPLRGHALQPTAGPVRLNANENPYGPSEAALDAIRGALGEAARYPDDLDERLRGAIAHSHGVSAGQVVVGAGSGEILKWAAATFTGPGRALVEAEPTFEDLSRHARVAGAEVVRVPLNARYEHDLPRMLDVARRADLVYLCSPNNPTATVTPAAALREFVAAVPTRTMILADEAYHHYATGAAYASLVDSVAAHPNLVVTRTFSKIYGMAGMRCGYAIAGEEAGRRLSAHQGWSSVCALTSAAALASLADAGHVARHRERNQATRAFVQAEVEKAGFRVLPSEANFVMIELGREVGPVLAALRERGVLAGRRFPALPRNLRVTIGREEEMRRFVEAFLSVVA
jgi:histidinol-phosphate aminotransferase